MRLNEKSIQIKATKKQEDIIQKRAVLFFTNIYVNPTYIIDKALNMFLESVNFEPFGELFKLLKHYC